jgi:hypothetical protein
VIGKIDDDWVNSLPFPVRSYLINTASSSLFKGWAKGYQLLKKLKPEFNNFLSLSGNQLVFQLLLNYLIETWCYAAFFIMPFHHICFLPYF